MPISLDAIKKLNAKTVERYLPTKYSPEDAFPLMLSAYDKRDALPKFLTQEKSSIIDALNTQGAVLFRGFQVNTAERFFHSISALIPEILHYSERSSPRHAVADRVYTSTDHPNDQHIFLHSEQSYTYNWPCFICFFCETKSTSGGNTPIANNRKILQHLPEYLVQKFEEYGVMYERNYTPEIGLSWQSAFQSDDKKQVEAFCKSRDIEWQWLNDDKLKTRQIRSAFQTHPYTLEKIWFNHALFFHITSLEEAISQALIASVGYDNVPTNTFFGNGESFSNSDLQAMRMGVSKESTTFEWEENDVLILDNMLCQHGREPFDGDRKALTLMAQHYQTLRSPLKMPPKSKNK